MRCNPVVRLTFAFGLALGAPGFAWADLILNGSFENTSAEPYVLNYQKVGTNPTGPDGNANDVTVYGWSSGGPNTYIQGTVGLTILNGPSNPPYTNNNGLGPSPDGGNYIAVDGQASFRSSISQTVTGLNIGDMYELQFYDGSGQQIGLDTQTTSYFQVSFGSSVQDGTSYTVPGGGFSGWYQETMMFVATSTSEVLNFTAFGTPAAPPYMVLDGVSMNDITSASVPEPSSLVLMGLACLCLGIFYVRRRLRFRAIAA